MVVRSNDTTGEELVYAMLLGKAERDEGNESGCVSTLIQKARVQTHALKMHASRTSAIIAEVRALDNKESSRLCWNNNSGSNSMQAKRSVVDEAEQLGDLLERAAAAEEEQLAQAAAAAAARAKPQMGAGASASGVAARHLRRASDAGTRRIADGDQEEGPQSSLCSSTCSSRSASPAPRQQPLTMQGLLQQGEPILQGSLVAAAGRGGRGASDFPRPGRKAGEPTHRARRFSSLGLGQVEAGMLRNDRDRPGPPMVGRVSMDSSASGQLELPGFFLEPTSTPSLLDSAAPTAVGSRKPKRQGRVSRVDGMLCQLGSNALDRVPRFTPQSEAFMDLRRSSEMGAATLATAQALNQNLARCGRGEAPPSPGGRAGTAPTSPCLARALLRSTTTKPYKKDMRDVKDMHRSLSMGMALRSVGGVEDEDFDDDGDDGPHSCGAFSHCDSELGGEPLSYMARLQQMAEGGAGPAPPAARRARRMSAPFSPGMLSLSRSGSIGGSEGSQPSPPTQGNAAAALRYALLRAASLSVDTEPSPLGSRSAPKVKAWDQPSPSGAQMFEPTPPAMPPRASDAGGAGGVLSEGGLSSPKTRRVVAPRNAFARSSLSAVPDNFSLGRTSSFGSGPGAEPGSNGNGAADPSTRLGTSLSTPGGGLSPKPPPPPLLPGSPAAYVSKVPGKRSSSSSGPIAAVLRGVSFGRERLLGSQVGSLSAKVPTYAETERAAEEAVASGMS